jgi:hypothetical protein
VCSAVVPEAINPRKSKYAALLVRLRDIYTRFDQGFECDEGGDDDNNSNGNDDRAIDGGGNGDGDSDGDSSKDGGGDVGGGNVDGDSDVNYNNSPLLARLHRKNGPYTSNQHFVMLGQEMARHQSSLIRTQYPHGFIAQFVNTAYKKKQFEATVKANGLLSRDAKKDAIKSARAKLAAIKSALIKYQDPDLPPNPLSDLLNEDDQAFYHRVRPIVVPLDNLWVEGPYGYHLKYVAIRHPERAYQVLNSHFSPFLSPLIST